MNANTALKINDAVDQAIRCGESPNAVRDQVERALAQAQIQKHENAIKFHQRTLEGLRA